MNKYIRLLNTSMQNSTAYRIEAFNWFIIAIISTIGSFVIFTTAAREGSITNYNASQIGLYIFFSLVVERIVGWYFSWELQNSINNGSISNLLIKPYNQLLTFGLNELGYKIVGNLPYITITFGLLTVVFLYVNPGNFTSIILFLVSISLSSLIGFYIAAVLGLMAFWLEKSGSLVSLFQSLIFILAGRGFPLDILPANILKIISFTPLPYIYFYPISGLIKDQGINYFAKVIGIQIFWTLILLIVTKLIWSKGIKKYESVGI